MSYDHEAIREAYPSEGLEIIDGKGIFKVNTGCSLVDAARVELNKLNYISDRLSGSTSYALIGDQLDMLYKDIVAGKLDTTGTWATHVKAVKDSNPKP